MVYLEGVAGTLLGVMAYELGGKFKLHTKLLCTFKIVCIGLILGLVVFRDSISYQDEMVYPYVFALLLLGIYYDNTQYRLPQLMENSILYLGKISYNIFLMHYGVCYLFSFYVGDNRLSYILPSYFIVIVMLAVLMERLSFLLTNRKKCGEMG